MTEESLFVAALEKPSAAERRAFLDAACGGDPGLRNRVEQLLAADERAGGILEHGLGAPTLLAACRPAPGLAADQPFAGRFHLRRKVGEGGMGEVWVADQTDPVRRRVALKVIRPGLDSARLLARFEAERQALALMDHPNIARVLDAGATDTGRPYFVMELVEGVPVTQFCDEHKLGPRQRLELFIPVCQAIQHAHQKGVIHRDLKPSNILVATYDGKPAPKVIDFGIAKATGGRLAADSLTTEVGALIGTLEYMSPEQADPNNRDIDTRSDVYALGVVLYELLTGAVPFSRHNLQAAPFTEMLRIIREVDPPKPSTRLAETRTARGGTTAGPTGPRPAPRVPRLYELDWIVMKCLEKDRTRRYESASALARDVERYLKDEPVQAGPPSAAYRVRKFLRRHRGPAVAAALVLLALVGGVVGTTVGLVRAERARETAEKRLAQVERGIDALGSVFEDLDPRAEEKEGRPLRAILGDRLDRAAAELEGEAVGDPLDVARLQVRLGRTYLGLDQPRKAERLLAKAAATRQAYLGDRDRLTLAARQALGQAYQGSGRSAEAAALLEQVRAAQVEQFGPDDSDTMATTNSLAVSYRWLNRHAEAIELLEQLRTAQEKQLKPDDPRLLTTLTNLAVTYSSGPRADEGVALLEHVLAVRRQAPGGLKHPETLHALALLGMAYQFAGKMTKGVELMKQAQNELTHRYGPTHESTLGVLDHLAITYRVFGQTRDAIALGEQVRAARDLQHGAFDPRTLTTIENLALAYQADGQQGRVLPLLEQAAAGVERLQFVHHRANITLDNLSRELERLGRHADAEAWRRKGLVAAQLREGTDSFAYAQALSGLGTNLVQQKEYARAEPPLREAVTLHRKHRPEELGLPDAEALLGGALMSQQKYAEAEPVLMSAHQGLTRCARELPPGHEFLIDGRLADVLDRLVRLSEAAGRPEEAARRRKELEALRPTTGGPGKQ